MSNKQLTEDGRIHLGIIHQVDTLKVLEQIKAVADDANDIIEFSSFTQQDFEDLIKLLGKYHAILKAIR